MLNSRSKHVELVQQHLQIAEDAYPHLLTLLIRHALSSSYVDKWVMARPVLNLVLLFPQQLALVRSGRSCPFRTIFTSNLYQFLNDNRHFILFVPFSLSSFDLVFIIIISKSFEWKYA